MTQSLIVRTRQARSSYPIEIAAGLIERSGQLVHGTLGRAPQRIAIVSNEKVFGLYGKRLCESLASMGSEVMVHRIGDGERYKNFRTLEQTLDFLLANELSRTDAIVALGGGVVGDLAGFAASIYLRGVDLVQIPTTLLSMIDSSVGGKTAVNSKAGKNLIGTFYQPKAVLIDPTTLATLPARETRAGLFEAVKQAALSGEKLMQETERMTAILTSSRPKGRFDDPTRLAGLEAGLAAQIRFKAGIVAGDERELAGRVDARSRKILNFGHTFGHALEKVTRYRRFLHGEAVGWGILFASALSKNLGLLSTDELKLLYDVVHRVGPLPRMDDIDPREIFATFKYDKKRINDSVQWILLESIGRPVIVPHTKIPASALVSAFKQAKSH